MVQLRHPSVVLFMGACLDSVADLAIVMEYCANGSLYSQLRDKSVSIDYNRINRCMLETAQGLLYLHGHSPPILHRDLKSLNVLVTDKWDVKVADFGLTEFKPDSTQAAAAAAANNATMLNASASDELQAAHLQLGTPFWLSPEAMEHQEFTEQSDVYAFGMLCWEMFTRELPFANLSPHQAALAVISEDKRPDIPLFVPPAYARLMSDCWTRNPRHRPTFAQVIERLQRITADGLPRIELSLNNTKLYRKRTSVFAFRSKDTVIVYKSWGTGEGKKGDWVLVGPGDDVYTCDHAIFLKTYAPVDEVHKPNLYRKIGSIFALEMKRPFLMATLEGMEHGSAGDWIAQNPVDGEQWPISKDTFASSYEVAPDQTLPPNARAAPSAAQQKINDAEANNVAPKSPMASTSGALSPSAGVSQGSSGRTAIRQPSSTKALAAKTGRKQAS